MISSTKYYLIKADAAFPAVLFLASFFFLFSFYGYGVSLLDEGYLVSCASRVLHGQVTYIDFQSNYAPGRYYFFAALFKLFGESLLVTRVAWVVLYAFAGVIAYFIARRAVQPYYAAMAGALVVLLRCPWQKTFFVFLQVLLIWAFFRFLDSRDRRSLILCGFATALTAVIRHDIGIYGFLSISLVVVITSFKNSRRETLKNLFFYSCSTALFFAPILLYYWRRGFLLEMLKQYLFSGVLDVNASTLPFPSSPGLFLLFILPLAIYAAAIALVAHRARRGSFDRDEYHRLFLAIFGTFVYIQILNRTDLPHLWQIFPPACLLLFFLWSDVSQSGLNRPIKLLSTAIFGIMIAGYLTLYFQASNPQAPLFVFHQDDLVTLDNSRARVRVPREYAKALTRVINTVQANTNQDDYIIAVPDIPMFYFLCERKNPLRYDLLRPGIADKPELQNEVVESLRNKKVPYMIFNEEEMWDGRPERRFENRAKIIYKYLMLNYTMVDRAGPFSIWRKKT